MNITTLKLHPAYLFIDKHRKWIYIAIAIIIGLLLISPKDIKWARDRENYLIFAHQGWPMIQYNLSHGIMTFLANEPLFFVINAIIYSFTNEFNTVKIIIFSASVITLLAMGSMTKYSFLNFLFFGGLPLILINYTTHLRQGLAMAIYFVGLAALMKGSQWKWIRLITPFIHSSMLFLLFFEFCELVFRKLKVNKYVKVLIFVVAVALMFMLLPSMLRLIGDRRFDAYDFSFKIAGSGLGLIGWVVIGAFYLIYGKDKPLNVMVALGMVFYLVSYFYLEFGARVLQALLPIMCVTVLNDDRDWFKRIMTTLLLGFGAFSWIKDGTSTL